MNNYRLDKKVEIKKVSALRNAVGEVVSDHVFYCQRFAEVIAKEGSERFSSGSDQAEKKWTIRLRHDSKVAAINEAMIAYYAGKLLRIECVINEYERNKWVILSCTEHGSDSAGGCNG